MSETVALFLRPRLRDTPNGPRYFVDRVDVHRALTLTERCSLHADGDNEDAGVTVEVEIEGEWTGRGEGFGFAAGRVLLGRADITAELNDGQWWEINEALRRQVESGTADAADHRYMQAVGK